MKYQNKPVTRRQIKTELDDLGLSLSIETLARYEKEGLYHLQMIPIGKRFKQYVTSRKEAEKIKRLLWVYHYGDDTPYPNVDIYGKQITEQSAINR